MAASVAKAATQISMLQGGSCPEAVVQHSAEECWGGWIGDVLLSRSLGPAGRHRERPAVRRRWAEYLRVVMSTPQCWACVLEIKPNDTVCQMNGGAARVSF